MKFGIIGAMDLEVNALKDKMDKAVITTISSVDFYSGKINGVETVVATAGVGKVNAAICAQTMILTFKPDIIINIGVAGGLSGEFEIGDIAVATAVVEHDMDTSPLGDPVGFISGMNKVYMDCDKELSDVLLEVANQIGEIKAIKGVIASGDQFISEDTARNRIKSNFNAITAEMEGASIGHVCTVNNVPFAVLRAISDGANDGATMDYPTFAKSAAKNSVRIMLNVLEKYSNL